MSKVESPIAKSSEAEEHAQLSGEHWGGYFKVLTPSMRPQGGKLGVSMNRLPPGRALVPFHHHRLEDEVFYILEGRGVLRYGDDLYDLEPGDCVSCPAGTQIAHQIANASDSDLVYLCIGNYEPHEVCVYPDTDKILVRGIGIGLLEKTPYMHGEPDRPRVFDLIESRTGSRAHDV